MTPPDGWGVGGIVGGAIALLTLLGGGVKWIADWGDRRVVRIEAARIDREARLAQEESALDGRWKDYTQTIEKRLDAMKDIEAARVKADKRRAEEMAAMRMAFELVAVELRKADPKNGALRRAEQILQRAFPLDLHLSPEMAIAASPLMEIPASEGGA